MSADRFPLAHMSVLVAAFLFLSCRFPQLSFNVQDTCIGSVVCRLYDDVMPRTAQAFRNFAITREATLMKSGLIFNDKQQLFLGEALNWVVEGS